MVITIAGQCGEGKTRLAAWLTQQLLDDEAIMGLKDPDVLKPIIDKLDVQIITQQINRDFKDVDMNPLMNSLYKEIKI
jgi:hypothetical protein